MLDVMSLCIGLAMAFISSFALILVHFGQGFGFCFMNTLQGPLARGTVNSTIRPKPSRVKDSTAVWY